MTRTTLKTLRDRLPTLAAIAAFVAFTLLVAAAGCASTPTSLAPLTGRYELRSVDGRSLPDDRLGGMIAGELVITADGRATRTVQHATSGIPGPITRRAAGTYRRRGEEITFRLLRDGRAVPEATWEVRGVVRPPVITLRYPGPTGGTVEERYVRVEG
jgi:hypothetical protein